MELVCWHCAECAGGAEGGACAGVRGGAVQTRTLLPVQSAEVQKGACALHIVQECRGAAGGEGGAADVLALSPGCESSWTSECPTLALGGANSVTTLHIHFILFNIGFIDFGYMGRSETSTRMTSAKYKKQKVIFRYTFDIPCSC